MKRYVLPFFVFTILCFVLVPNSIHGQQPQTPPDMTIDAATRTAVVDSLLKELSDGYVFPDTAKRMESALQVPGHSPKN